MRKEIIIKNENSNFKPRPKINNTPSVKNLPYDHLQGKFLKTVTEDETLVRLDFLDGDSIVGNVEASDQYTILVKILEKREFIYKQALKRIVPLS